MLRSLILLSSIALSLVHGDDNSHTVRLFLTCNNDKTASMCIQQFETVSLITNQSALTITLFAPMSFINFQVHS